MSRSSTGGGSTTTSMSFGHHCELELEALLARDARTPDHHVERRADRTLAAQRVGHVEHEDAVDRTGERVRDRHEVHDRAVDERAPVAAPRAGRSRAAPRWPAARGAAAPLTSTHLVARHRGRRRRPAAGSASSAKVRPASAPCDHPAQALVREQVVVAAEEVPRPLERATGEDLVAVQAAPHAVRARSTFSSVGAVAIAAPLSAPAEVPTTTSGTMSALEQGAQHPDLADALVAAARQHERGDGLRGRAADGPHGRLGHVPSRVDASHEDIGSRPRHAASWNRPRMRA